MGSIPAMMNNPYTLPLTPDAFSDALAKGLGRAYEHILVYGDAGVEQILLDECLTYSGYDPQCEGGRAEWLDGMIQLGEDPAGYEAAILSHFTSLEIDDSTVWYTVAQLYELAVCFAKRGNLAAHQAVYDRFAKLEHIVPSTFDNGERNETFYVYHLSPETYLVELDGLDGLLFAGRLFGSRMDQFPNCGVDTFWMEELFDQFDYDRIYLTLNKAACLDPPLYRWWQATLSALRAADSSSSNSSRHNKQPWPFATLLVELSKDHYVSPYFLRLSWDALDAQQREKLLFHMQRETRAISLGNYLRMIKGTVENLPVDYLLRLLEHADADVQWFAAAVLAPLPYQALRQTGLDLLQKGFPRFRLGVELLQHHLQEEDLALLETVLQSGQPERDDAHAIGLRLEKLCKQYPTYDWAWLMMWVYRSTPCSLCRSYIVEWWIEQDGLPSWLLHECRWDCQEDIRELTNYNEAPLPNGC